MENANVEYYKSANWAHVNGNFTPDELREIAKEIEERREDFRKEQASEEG